MVWIRFDVLGHLSLGALDHVKPDPSALLERLEPVHGDRAEVGKDVTAAVGLDEAETLGIVEPFDSTSRHVQALLFAFEAGWGGPRVQQFFVAAVSGMLRPPVNQFLILKYL